jgi:hypothetical protein
MGLDARSRERLEQLGRRLPQPLPQPDGAADTAPTSGGHKGPRHRLETETDPQELFRELMQASPDGQVPAHLLQRLRDLEQRSSTITLPAASAAATTAGPVSKRRLRPGGEQDPLYVSFEQMLLEDESL